MAIYIDESLCIHKEPYLSIYTVAIHKKPFLPTTEIVHAHPLLHAVATRRMKSHSYIPTSTSHKESSSMLTDVKSLPLAAGHSIDRRWSCYACNGAYWSFIGYLRLLSGGQTIGRPAEPLLHASHSCILHVIPSSHCHQVSIPLSQSANSSARLQIS